MSGSLGARHPSRSLLGLVAVTALLVAGVVSSGFVHDSSAVREPLRQITDLPSSLTHASGDPDGDLGGRSVAPTDMDEPAIAQLDPALRSAVQRAAEGAGRDGVTLRVNSGWRSAAYQEELLRRAVRQYGSLSEAREWVDTPQHSSHVRGEAVDVGPPDAARWLERHGAAFGLCRVYANELWHFERRVRPGGDCPPLRRNAGAG